MKIRGQIGCRSTTLVHVITSAFSCMANTCGSRSVRLQGQDANRQAEGYVVMVKGKIKNMKEIAKQRMYWLA